MCLGVQFEVLGKWEGDCWCPSMKLEVVVKVGG